MRIIPSHLLPTALRIVAAGGLLAIATAATHAQVIPVAPATGTQWRYNQVQDLSAANWTALGYDDSGGSWLGGPSGFSYETGANDVRHDQANPALTLVRTQLSDPATDPVGTPRHARYFRKKFTWNNSTANAAMKLVMRWDDSGIIYLNGQVIYNNTGANPPLGFTTYTRGAIGAGTEGTVDELATVDVSSILVAGENILAAENHQVNATSSDVVFVCDASVILPYGPLITDSTQPTNRVVLQSRTTVLQCIAEGYPDLSYQWYHDGNPVGDATNSSLTISNFALADAGMYFCRVTNTRGSVDSRNANVQFTSDSEAPTVVTALGSANFTEVTIQFSEPLRTAEAVDSFNYTVTDAAMNTYSVDTATLNPGESSVTLSHINAGPHPQNTMMSVHIEGLFDVVGNAMAPATVSFTSWTLTGATGMVFEAFRPLSTTDNSLNNTLLLFSNYPSKPDERFLARAMDTRTVYPDDSHEGYGGRIRGLFIAPFSGAWVFYLGSDDSSRLFLNPTGPNAAGKVLIQEETGCCNNWPAHTSAPQNLVAGQAYYIEAIYKEGTGGDYCKVAARLQSEGAPPDNPNGQQSVSDYAISGSRVGSPAAPANVVGPVLIVQNPISITVPAPNPAVFSVVATNANDAPIWYQWQRSDNGGATFNDIPGANLATFTIAATDEATDNGDQFRVVASVAGATVTSAAATLTVGIDHTPPTVLSASGNAFGTNVTVTFNEALDTASSQVAGNYRIDGVAPASATLTGPAVVVLVPASPISDDCHQVQVSGVKDLGLNTVSPNPTTVSFRRPSLVMNVGDGAAWRYDQSGVDLGTGWVDPGFNDGGWSLGHQPFDAKNPDRDTLPGVNIPVATKLQLTNTTTFPVNDIPTYYLRTHINLTVDPASIDHLRLRTLLDDGMVVYLNGQVGLNVRVPDPAFATYCTGAPNGDATYEGPYDLPTTNLHLGDNVVAILLKNSANNSSDITLGLELIAESSKCSLPPLQITQSGNNLIITWPANPPAVLQKSTAIPGNWSDAVGIISGQPTPKPSVPTFYRTRSSP